MGGDYPIREPCLAGGFAALHPRGLWAFVRRGEAGRAEQSGGRLELEGPYASPCMIAVVPVENTGLIKMVTGVYDVWVVVMVVVMPSYSGSSLWWVCCCGGDVDGVS